MTRHTLTLCSALLALSLGGCSNSHGYLGGDCEGEAPACWRQFPRSCCDVSVDVATCVDGVWTCSGDDIPEPSCRRYTATSPECAVMPPIDGGDVDGGTPPPPPPFDGGPPSDCAELGPAACFAELDCAPLFDDACCPLCGPGPCADCVEPVYAGCIFFDDCRAPSCGVVPSWGCFPSAPGCTGANPLTLTACDQFGCVPAYPAGAGAPSLADAECVPITGDSCTTACRRLPPECPTGTVPEGDGFCYTDRCIPAFVCD